MAGMTRSDKWDYAVGIGMAGLLLLLWGADHHDRRALRENADRIDAMARAADYVAESGPGLTGLAGRTLRDAAVAVGDMPDDIPEFLIKASGSEYVDLELPEISRDLCLKLLGQEYGPWLATVSGYYRWSRGGLMLVPVDEVFCGSSTGSNVQGIIMRAAFSR